MKSARWIDALWAVALAALVAVEASPAFQRAFSFADLRPEPAWILAVAAAAFRPGAAAWILPAWAGLWTDGFSTAPAFFATASILLATAAIPFLRTAGHFHRPAVFFALALAASVLKAFVETGLMAAWLGGRTAWSYFGHTALPAAVLQTAASLPVALVLLVRDLFLSRPLKVRRSR